jgi:hypothetical protein
MKNKKYFFKQYIWFSPELNVFVLQTVMEGTCGMHFEWDNLDLILACKYFDMRFDPISQFLWMPLGEL